ncbi:MAG TPA: hypothetical protein PKI93_05810 [Alphaproteobacteria bacterium]|nr:hypothetical protein [Alphaproteobacteria bacterium]HNS44452.1 hypothetical protein [Alphaproteobacteria bacterium]
MELNTTLLRERFVIRDLASVEAGVPESVVAMSNRIVVPLVSRSSGRAETFVIRSRIMHSAIRMAAQIIQIFASYGPLMTSFEPVDFGELWQRCDSDHDRIYDENPWICVYYNAKPVFESGKRHPFLDVIEKCDLRTPGNYDGALTIAEDTFKKMGRQVSISHNSNIGMVVNIKQDIGRCGMILRNPHKGTTFNYVAEKREGGENVNSALCLNACADFLDGIQLAVRLGMSTEKHRHGLIAAESPEVREMQSARERLETISREIKEFENRFDVRYRLERPDFKVLAREAELFQKQLIDSGHRS